MLRLKFLPNAHPGEILAAEFLKPMELSQTAITADRDLRLARYFGLNEGFFLRLQNDFNLMEHRRKIGGVLKGSDRGRWPRSDTWPA